MNVEALITEIRREHDIRLAKDDPVLVTVLLGEKVMAQAARQIEAAMHAGAEQITAAQVQAQMSARRDAEALITEAAGWLTRQMHEAAERAAQEAVGRIEAEGQRAARAANWANRAAWVAGACALVCSCAAIGWLLAMMRLFG